MICKRQLLYNILKQKENVEFKVGELNARKGWLHNFRKSFGLKNVTIAGEEAFAYQKAANSQMPWRKVLRRKGICPNRFLAQTKVHYSEKKMQQRKFLSKEEKWVPRFKADRNRLTVLFCAGEIGFMIRISHICKTANSQAWRKR